MLPPAFNTTPNTCGILGLLHQGLHFSTALITDLIAIQSRIQSAAAAILSLPSRVVGIVMGQVSALASSLIAMATGAVAGFISHVTAQLTNAITNLSMSIGQAAAQAGLLNSGCALPSNPGGDIPCGNMSTLFGSVMGLGATLMNSMMGALDKITGNISGLISGALSNVTAVLGLITSGITQMANFAIGMANMIAGEVAALATMLSDMIKFSAANALSNLFNNPCTNQVLRAISSPALLSNFT